MLAFKFLAADRTTAITGFRWPEPSDGWVEARGALERCRCGIHACRPDDLAHWLGPELWLVELEGEVLDTPDSVIARRGRLVRRVEAWADGGLRAFAHECGRRAAELAAPPSREATGETVERAQAAVANAEQAKVGLAAYIAAAVAGEVVSGGRRGALYDEAFEAERMRQGRWLQDHLDLPALTRP